MKNFLAQPNPGDTVYIHGYKVAKRMESGLNAHFTLCPARSATVINLYLYLNASFICGSWLAIDDNPIVHSAYAVMDVVQHRFEYARGRYKYSMSKSQQNKNGMGVFSFTPYDAR